MTAGRMHADEIPVGVELVARLIAEQYPQWSALELSPLEPWGTVPTYGAPPAHNRARPLAEYDEGARQVISSAADLIDAEVALEIWEAGLAAEPHEGSLRWVHGDLEGNCLVLDGHLVGLVDWGSACVGDPAVDVQVAWSPLFTDESRARFLERLNPSDATIRRARAMAIQQACAALPYYLHTYPLIVERSWRKLAALGVPAKIERL